MSQMIPRETIDALRKAVNVSLDSYGIDCDLYIPDNLSTTETSDIYQKPIDYNFVHYTTKVFIQWSPNIWRLKGLGMYVEDQTPILAYFGSEAVNDSNKTVAIDVLRHSYIIIEPEYIPDNFEGIEEFEVIDIGVPHMHDAVISRVYKLVPRRYENVSG